MIEFELKFQVPAQRRQAVKSFVSGRARRNSRQIHLQAAYFDTPDRLLARHSMALRLRREGAEWVQTLKGSGGDGLARQEHNVALGAAAVDFAAPEVEPARHADVPVGDRLIEMLRRQSAGGLCCRYRTDVRRVVRDPSTRFGKVELAFDEGFIEAGGRRLPLCELEIELIDGHPSAVLDVARRWALRFGLWLDTRSKAERGDMLANGVELAAPVEAGEVRIRSGDSAALALRAVLADCRRQALANASQIAGGSFDSEHLHQLQVGLRRLRTALRLFDDGAEVGGSTRQPLGKAADMLLRGFAASREQIVCAERMSPAIEAALPAAGQHAGLPRWISEPIAATPCALVRGADCQRLLLDLIEAGLPAFSVVDSSYRPVAAEWPTGSAPDARHAARTATDEAVAGRLARWHRAVLRDMARAEQLDDADRRRLRARIEEVVDGVGLAASLYKRKPLRRLLKNLKPVRRCLAELDDVVMARQKTSRDDDLGWFAAGWLVARRQALLEEASLLLRRAAAGKPLRKRNARSRRRSLGEA